MLFEGVDIVGIVPTYFEGRGSIGPAEHHTNDRKTKYELVTESNRKARRVGA